jgi:hypothetical protein
MSFEEFIAVFVLGLMIGGMVGFFLGVVAKIKE